MSTAMNYPDELDKDPVVSQLPDQLQPSAIGAITKVDIVNAGLHDLVAVYDKLTDLTNWLDKHAAVAAAVRSNKEEDYKRAEQDAFAAVPKSDGPEPYRWAKAAVNASDSQKEFQQARMRHEVLKAELRGLERQLKVVDATIWVRKAVMAGKGY